MRSNTNFTDRLQFDSVAESYDRLRPLYPKSLFDDVCRLAGLKAGSRLLDVGCGTGQMSVPFAERGLVVTALEPGKNLATITRRKLAPYKNCQVVEGFFEDFVGNKESFNCIVSANAFHWVRPDIGYQKIYNLLKLHGSVALFWNFPSLNVDDARVLSVGLKDLPASLQMFADDSWSGASMNAGAAEMQATGLFGPISQYQYNWEVTLRGDEYADFLSTYANYARLSPADRTAILNRIAEVIYRDLAGRVRLIHDGHLRFTKKVV